MKRLAALVGLGLALLIVPCAPPPVPRESALAAQEKSPARGAAPAGPAEPVQARPHETVQVEVTFDPAKKFLWTPGFNTADCLVARMYDDRPGKATFWCQPKREGTYYVTMILQGEEAFGNFVIQCTPVVPNPPTPQPPTPKPPDPTPQPPEKKNLHRVLFLLESNARMTNDQLLALNSVEVRKYLDAHCARDSDGRPGYRYWDAWPPGGGPLDVSREPKEWQDIWGIVAPKLGQVTPPVYAVGYGGKADVYPVTTEADMLATIKSYATAAAKGK